MLRDTVNGYGALSRLLHWALFICIVCQLLLALSFVYWPLAIPTTLFLHKSLGVVILVLGLVFIGWRWMGPKPSLAGLPLLQRLLARLVHVVIYVMIIVQPVLGLLAVFANGKAVPVFGWFDIPAFPVSGLVGNTAFMLHTAVIWWILLGAVALHVLGALYHEFIQKDDILRRMLPWRSERPER